MVVEYALIKEKNHYCSTEESFKSCLTLDDSFLVRDGTMEYNGHVLNYNLEKSLVNKEKYVYFGLKIESDEEDNCIVETFEEIDSRLHDLFEKNGQFSVYTISDGVSFYYSEKLFNKIYLLENRLRRIIYVFMLKTVGEPWIEEGTPKKFYDNIKSIVERNKIDFDSMRSDWLMYCDFIDLSNFMTIPYPLCNDNKKLSLDMDQLSDAIEKNNNVERIVKELIRLYKPSSNWTRYFGDVLDGMDEKSFKKDWAFLYDVRNRVFHGRTIRRQKFNSAIEKIDEFNKAFDECILRVSQLNVDDDDSKAIKTIAENTVLINRIDNNSLTSTFLTRSFDSSAYQLWKNGIVNCDSMNNNSIVKMDNDTYALKLDNLGNCRLMPPLWEIDDGFRDIYKTLDRTNDRMKG